MAESAQTIEITIDTKEVLKVLSEYQCPHCGKPLGPDATECKPSTAEQELERQLGELSPHVTAFADAVLNALASGGHVSLVGEITGSDGRQLKICCNGQQVDFVAI